MSLVWVGILAGQAWHSRNLPLEDGLGTFYSVGVVLQVAQTAGILDAAQAALAHGPYVLQPLIAAALHGSVPLHWSVGAILDGLWLVVAATSLGWFFWRRTRSLIWTPLLAVVPLLHPIVLRDPGRGLIGLHADFVGCVLSFAVIALLQSSHRLRHRTPTIFGGLLVGCLVLGRWATAVLLTVMCIPFAWDTLRARSRFASLRGARLFFVAAALTCAWWLPLRFQFFFEYFLVWYGRPGGNIGGLDRQSTPRFLYSYAAEVLGGRSLFVVLLLLLAVLAAPGLRKRPIHWSALNWPFAWLALGPLVLLLILRSDHAQYAYPASLGVYLSLLFPTRTARRPTICTIRGGGLFAPAIIAVWFVSLFNLSRLGAGPDRDKVEALRIADAVKRCESRPCRVGVVYWGALNAPNLVNVLIYDRKLTASASPDHVPPSMNVDFLIDGSLAFPPDALSDKPPVVPRCQDMLVVLSEASWRIRALTPFPYHWPRWARLSEAVLTSGLYEGSETVYSLRPWETVHVLRRVSGAPACAEGRLP